jgi:hypothetical protein
MKLRDLAIVTGGALIAVIAVMLFSGSDASTVSDGTSVVVAEQRPLIEELVRAYEAGDEELLKKYSELYEFGSLDGFKAAIKEHIEYQAKAEVRYEREKTLGTWKEAVGVGKVVHVEVEGAYTTKYFDVTEDGVGDFEVVFKNGEPRKWRYIDKDGVPYG